MHSKNRFCTVAALLILGVAAVAAWEAKAQELDWATSAGGAAGARGAGIATDLLGNSYVTGTFRDTATFGAGEANETVLGSVGGEDAFVAKYARDGTLLWAKSAADALGGSIATDLRGNSYVTGGFLDIATFGAGEANETVLTSVAFDVYVAKFARDGTLLWAKSAGGNDDDSGSGIATDLRGNSYVTGAFDPSEGSPATFGAGEANETVLTGEGVNEIFVAKYAPDGALLWARSAGGDDDDVGAGIATDLRGNSYVTGRFEGQATFGAGEANETVLSGAGEAEVFVAKYARDGAFLWATSAGGGGRDAGTEIATDPRGNSYLTGSFEGQATFGAGEADETELSGAGAGNAFVAKYQR